MCPWGPFRSTKTAVNLHTLLDLQGSIPASIYISDGKLHDVNVLDLLLAEPGAIYVMNCSCFNCERLFALRQIGAFFVTRAKSNFKCRRGYSLPADRSSGLICSRARRRTRFDPRISESSKHCNKP